MKTTVLLVDDHPFVREGIRSFLSDLPDFEVVGEAMSGAEAVKMAQQLAPDLILLDINMPEMSGLEAVGRLRKGCPAAKILVLTVHNSREYVLHVAKSGAHGYILKEAPPEELLLAITSIRSGQKYYSPAVAGHVFDDYERPISKRVERQLTPREVEVLIHTAKGSSIKKMAEELNITPATAQTYRVRIMEKLQIRNIAGLVKYAVQKGFAPLEES